VRFQLDEHVPNAVARALRGFGIDVLTMREAGLLGTPDAELLAHAHAEGRVLVTHDPDFLRLHDRQVAHAGIAYCAQGSRTVGQIVESLRLIHEVYQPDEMVDRVEYL
jgi:predicted nuclease of predicted toxin-antitoxin system